AYNSYTFGIQGTLTSATNLCGEVLTTDQFVGEVFVAGVYPTETQDGIWRFFAVRNNDGEEVHFRINANLPEASYIEEGDQVTVTYFCSGEQYSKAEDVTFQEFLLPGQ